MKYSMGQKIQQTREIEVSQAADVVIAGGGTAGITAAIAAARNGADVLIIEKNGYLGGLMTAGNMGLTTYIVHEKDSSKHDKLMQDLAENPEIVHVAGGLVMEITRHLENIGGAVTTKGQPGTYVFTSQGEFKYLLMTMAKEAGVRMLFHTIVTGATKSDSSIDGVIIENKSGCSMIVAKQFIDAPVYLVCHSADTDSLARYFGLISASLGRLDDCLLVLICSQQSSHVCGICLWLDIGCVDG